MFATETITGASKAVLKQWAVLESPFYGKAYIRTENPEGWHELTPEALADAGYGMRELLEFEKAETIDSEDLAEIFDRECEQNNQPWDEALFSNLQEQLIKYTEDTSICSILCDIYNRLSGERAVELHHKRPDSKDVAEMIAKHCARKGSTEKGRMFPNVQTSLAGITKADDTLCSILTSIYNRLNN